MLALAVFAAALTFNTQARAADEKISAECAIVYAPESGQTLFEKNADDRRLIASTTKIMTALVVLEHCALDEMVEVRPEHAAVEGSSMYLVPGGEYTVEDLLYGMMLVSGNDAAAALADHVSGSMENFAGLMNEKCRELGLENTHFSNAHGLDAEEHYSSARDLALITAAAMENSDFRTIFAAKSRSIAGADYYNHNKLLTSCPGCIGGKTGYTRAAGRTLVSCVRREGMTLICVTIADPDDWRDHASLYDAMFGEYRFVPLSGLGSIHVISGVRETVYAEPGMQGIAVRRGSEVSVTVYMPRFVFAPVRAGGEAGEIELTVDGTARTVPLYYCESVPLNGAEPLTLWERIQRLWYISCRYGVYYPYSGH